MGEDLKNSVEAADINVQYDTAAKVLLAHKSILSRILVATVDEFKGMSPDDVEGFIEGDVHIGNVPVDPGLTNAETGERIVGLNTVQPEIREGYVTFDVIFYVRMKDGLSQIIINVEAQKDDTPGYDILNRAIFYVSRLISSQKERDFTGSHYDDLKRVYSIWICMNMDVCSWDYFHLTDDVIIPGHKWNGKCDLLNIVLLGIPNELPEQGEEYELHRLLSTMFSVELTSKERLNILENEYGIDVKPDFRKELDTMCNLSQGVYERGMEKGIQQGKLENAKAMAISMHNDGMKEEQIAKYANVDVELVRKWLGFSLT
ncbi:MAG: hypothetical protein LUH18_01975 [Oscillospiraceae bacterium]|nr:hypothetical protein [Oscillospiraceae bacterium]